MNNLQFGVLSFNSSKLYATRENKQSILIFVEKGHKISEMRCFQHISRRTHKLTRKYLMSQRAASLTHMREGRLIKRKHGSNMSPRNVNHFHVEKSRLRLLSLFIITQNASEYLIKSMHQHDIITFGTMTLNTMLDVLISLLARLFGW